MDHAASQTWVSVHVVVSPSYIADVVLCVPLGSSSVSLSLLFVQRTHSGLSTFSFLAKSTFSFLAKLSQMSTLLHGSRLKARASGLLENGLLQHITAAHNDQNKVRVTCAFVLCACVFQLHVMQIVSPVHVCANWLAEKKKAKLESVLQVELLIFEQLTILEVFTCYDVGEERRTRPINKIYLLEQCTL